MKVYKYAQLGYSAARIVTILGIFGPMRDALVMRMNDETTEEGRIFLLGEARGMLNADETLNDILRGDSEDEDKIKAQKALSDSAQSKRARDLKKELFGL